MRKRILVLLVVGLLMAAWTPCAPAQTTTTLSNVAVQQPATGNGANPARGADDGVYRYYEGDNTVAENYWTIDLGQAYNVHHLLIDTRYNDAYGPLRLNGATLMAFGADGLTRVAPDLVLSGFLASTETGGPVYRLPFDNGGAGYAGARYFQIGGRDPNDPLSSPCGVDYLTVGEFKAYAQVPVYNTFIQNVVATANISEVHVGVSPTFLVDNSGMDDQRTLLGDPAAKHLGLTGQGMWSSGKDPAETPVLTFDLGTTYDLNQISVWNSHQNVLRNIKECLFERSLNGTDWTELADTNGEGLGNYTLTANDFTTGTAPWPATDAISLTNVTTRYVRMSMLSNYGPNPTDPPSYYYGLSEIRFYGTEATTTTPIPGDTNNDKKVNAEDAKNVASNWGGTVTHGDVTKGDFNNDGLVNAADASILAANWGDYTEGAGQGSVPEPSVAVLLLGAMLAVVARRARR